MDVEEKNLQDLGGPSLKDIYWIHRIIVSPVIIFVSVPWQTRLCKKEAYYASEDGVYSYDWLDQNVYGFFSLKCMLSLCVLKMRLLFV